MRFLHSGKLGDIVYSLPAVKAFGSSEIYLQADSPHGFSLSDANRILPLLRRQSYVSRAEVFAGEEGLTSFEGFRAIATGPTLVNLADCHLQLLGLGSGGRDKEWIDGVCPSPATQGRIVISRTGNYPGIPEFWPKCVELFASMSVFVGHPHEYLDFRQFTSHVPYLPTKDLLELASAIAGSRLLIGSQSCAFAIAEGLKHPAIQQTCPWVPNCVFERQNALHVRSVSDLNRIESFYSEVVSVKN